MLKKSWATSLLNVCACALLLVQLNQNVAAHPLRLSLTEVEYSSENQLLSVSLRLFVMDINEAITFDPESTELSLGEPTESQNAETLLLEYLNQFFFINVNNKTLGLKIKSKKLHGEGINTALGVVFEWQHLTPLTSLEIKNAVFTDLFFDQSNIIYVHIDEDSKSFMLNKDTPTHLLEF